MMAGRISARALTTALLTLALLAIGPAARAIAAPALTIEQPLAGSASTDQLPLFSGSGEDELDLVSVRIYKGPSAEGEPVETLVTTLPPFAGKWEVADEAPLAPAQYTAVAEQEAEGESVLSAPVTFTVEALDTTAPAVSIDPVTSPTSNATPTITGGAGVEAGDGAVTVTIYKGAAAEGEIASTGEAATEGAAWSYSPTHLADGTYTAQATQHDEAGNTGTSTAVTFTIDTTPPKVSIDPVTSPTNDATPTLTGDAGTEAGDGAVTVTIYKGAAAEGEIASTGLATGGSAWKYTPAKLPDGTYTAQASQHDEAGNANTSTTATFTVDTTAPAVSIDTVTSPTNDPTPTLTGDAGTETGDGAVTVTIYKGSSASGGVASTGEADTKGSTWSYTPTHLADGTYTAQATQQDEAGNTRASVAVTFTVDATAPAPTIVTPTEGALLNASKTTIAGLAGKSSGDLQTVKLKIYFGVSITPIKTLTLSASAGKWTTGASSPVLGNGPYTAVAEQADEAGNVGTSSVSFTISTGSPTVTLDTTAFVDRESAFYSDATPSFSGTGSTAPEDSPTILVKIYKGESTSGSPIREIESALSGSKWNTSPLATLPDGTYTVRAAQTTSNSNPTGESAPVTFTVDGHAPAVTLTTPANASTTSSSSEPLAGAAGTAAGDSSTVTVHLYAGPSATGVPLQAVSVQASSGAWSTAAGGLEPGTYTARAEQSDDVGNVGLSAPATFTVTTSSPSVTLATSAAVHRAGTLFSNATPSFSGSGSTALEDSNTIHVKIYNGASTSGSPVRDIEAALTGTKWQTGPATALPDGPYTAIAEQATSNPNVTGLSSTIPFTVDGNAPSVTLTTPADGSTTTTSSQPLTGAAGTAAGDSTTVTVQLYAGSGATGAPLQAIVVHASAGTWSTVAGGLEPGTYTARAEQSDDVGNVGLSAPATFTVTKPAPPPPPVITPVTPVTPPVVSPITPPAPALMQPFPVVRIAGSVTSSGVKVSLLSVQAPIGATVSVTCRGHGCPAKRQQTVPTTGRGRSTVGLVTITFRRFERALRAGASLQIRVFETGQIGKYTRFTIRRGKLPLRVDTCLSATANEPMKCPS